MKKKYELTPEHRAQLKPWADKWTKLIMSTEAMTEEDKERCRVAVNGLYAAANLPPPKHIVFVPSPFVLAFAGGFAAGIWQLSKGSAATEVATRAATEAATVDATRAATRADLSTWYPNLAATMRRAATELAGPNVQFLLDCANNRWRMWHGGNQWGQYVSFLSFFRHVAGLPLNYSKWDHYEVLATLSGPRVMHADFCMISDKPEVLTVDEQNRPHNDTGPFCRWRDGTALYAVHGVYVPGWIVERPEEISVEKIHAEENTEVRRIMVERYGLSRYVRDAQFEVLDDEAITIRVPVWRDGAFAGSEEKPSRRRLLRRGELVVVELENRTVDGDGTTRMYHVPCHPELRPLLENGELGEPQAMTALNGVASTYGMRGEEYALEVES